jgi:hypothetical protein
MNPLFVDITADDILGADRVSPSSDPVARAFARQYPGSSPYVNADGIAFTFNGMSLDIPITDEAIDWIDSWDNTGRALPCRLKLCEDVYEMSDTYVPSVPLTKELLDLIEAVKSFDDFVGARNALFKHTGVFCGTTTTMEFLASVPKQLLEKYHLVANEFCLDVLLMFKVTPTMRQMGDQYLQTQFKLVFKR